VKKKFQSFKNRKEQDIELELVLKIEVENCWLTAELDLVGGWMEA
jgi:hypothetical protein